MKIISFLVVAIFSITSYAGPKANSGKKDGRPEITKSGKMADVEAQLSKFNRDVTKLTSDDVRFEIPKGMNDAELAEFSARLARTLDKLRDAEVDLLSRKDKSADVASLLNSLSKAYAARSKFVEAQATGIVEVIDGGFKYIEAKLADTPEKPVSTSQVDGVFEDISSTRKPKLDQEDVDSVETKIRSRFDDKFTLEQIARCVL